MDDNHSEYYKKMMDVLERQIKNVKEKTDYSTVESVKADSEESSATCNGICNQFKVKKPSGASRYASGQGHCQICDAWIDHNGCHVKDGSPAQEDSVGWFCNCCNYRVRQTPRNKKYKDKFRARNEDVSFNEDLIAPEDLHIGKGQARLLKNLVKYMPNFSENTKLEKILERIPKSEKYQIEDNWGNVNHFLKLATEYFEINKISGIVLFEKLCAELGHVPQKEEFLYKFPVDNDWIKNEFKSWEQFLDLLNYDPWYRDKKQQKNKDIFKSESINDELVTENETTENETTENETTENNIENIRKKLVDYFKQLDAEESYLDFSYEEMFELFEKYLKILPNKSYISNIKHLF